MIPAAQHEMPPNRPGQREVWERLRRTLLWTSLVTVAALIFVSGQIGFRRIARNPRWYFALDTMYRPRDLQVAVPDSSGFMQIVEGQPEEFGLTSLQVNTSFAKAGLFSAGQRYREGGLDPARSKEVLLQAYDIGVKRLREDYPRAKDVLGVYDAGGGAGWFQVLGGSLVLQAAMLIAAAIRLRTPKTRGSLSN